MKLIDRAFKERYHVIIGVTTDSFAKKLGKADIEPFELRIKKIREYIERKYLGKSFSIIP
ncbi:MAG: cytidyltransferase, partial [Deltaproteobacteria bacterium]